MTIANNTSRNRRRAWKTALFVCAPCLNLAGCALDSNPEPSDSVGAREQPVLDGRATDNKNYPAVGLVELPSDMPGYVDRGTGTLIGSKYVLTAAHVVWGKATQPTAVSFSLFNGASGSPRVYYGVKAIRIHPSYKWHHSDPLWSRIWGENDATATYDVAVLELTNPVPGVAPMVLDQNESAVGNSVRFAGYGQISTGGGVPYSAPTGALYDGYNSISSIDPTFIRTIFNPGTQGTFHGDSGGPLFVKGIAAVVTSGTGSAYKSSDSFTRIYPILHWVVAAASSNPLDSAADTYETPENYPNLSTPPRKSARPLIDLTSLRHYAEPRTFHSGADIDTLGIQLLATQKVLFATDQQADGVNPNPTLELWSNGVQVPLQNLTRGIENLYSATLAAGTYDLLARHPSGPLGHYVLSASVDTWVPSADRFEPNSVIGYATYSTGLPLNVEVSASCSYNDEDFYEITLPKAQNLRIMTDALDHAPNRQYEGDTVVSLVRKESQDTVIAVNDDRPSSRYSTVEVPNLAAGSYYIRVKGYMNSRVPYYSLSAKPY